MAVKGRKPLPTSTKKKKGTAQNSRILKNEYAPDLVKKMPAPPDYFNSYSIDEFYKVGEKLLADGLLADIDITLFEVYCNEIGIYKNAQDILNKDGRVIKLKGSGYMQPHPYVAIANNAQKMANSLAASFGITPSARTRVSGKTKDDKPGNPITKLINIKKGLKHG